MKIHTLTTGTVRVKRSFLMPSPGARRQLNLFLPDEFSEPLPIHCWAIEHEGILRLVDTGETAAARNVPFAKFQVTPEQELPGALAGAGLELADVSEVVLTHAHGDHIDGVNHVRGRVMINEAELLYVNAAFSRVMRRVMRQPLPARFAPETFALDGGQFGAFPNSRALSDDGRIVAVPTPGHTPGHISVICVDDAGRHVMLAGDATDTLEQLHARRAARTRSDRTQRCTSRRSKPSSLTARNVRRSTFPRTTPTLPSGSRAPLRPPRARSLRRRRRGTVPAPRRQGHRAITVSLPLAKRSSTQGARLHARDDLRACRRSGAPGSGPAARPPDPGGRHRTPGRVSHSLSNCRLVCLTSRS